MLTPFLFTTATPFFVYNRNAFYFFVYNRNAFFCYKHDSNFNTVTITIMDNVNETSIDEDVDWKESLMLEQKLTKL